MKATLIASVLMVAIAAAQSPQADYVLDILSLERPTPDGRPIGVFADLPTITSSRRDAPELSVRLVTLDREDYVLGDDYVYEVLVENVGRRAVSLPWSLALPEPGRNPNQRQAFLHLKINVLGTSKFVRLLAVALRGSPSQPGTLQILQPKQKALVRVPGQWRTTGDQLISALGPDHATSVSVTAVFALAEDAVVAESTNQVKVLLSRER